MTDSIKEQRNEKSKAINKYKSKSVIDAKISTCLNNLRYSDKYFIEN